MIELPFLDGPTSSIAFAPIFVGLVSLGIGIQGYLQYRGAKASLRWRPVEGLITRSVLSRQRSGNRTIYVPAIAYEYRVAGRDYEGERVYFGAGGWRMNRRARCEALIMKYPVGSRVQVFVDPTRHDQAVLEQGVFEVARETLIMAGIFGALCLVFTYAVVVA